MNILFIDDDRTPILHYLKDLSEEGFNVRHCRKADEAVTLVSEKGSNFDLIILDSAMPPGQRYANSDTEEGLATGSRLFEDIRKLCPTLPVLVLTNFNGLEWTARACRSQGVREARKPDTNSAKLVDIVRQMTRSRGPE